MRIKIPIGLIIISVIAILIDCYAGYALFLMTAMAFGPDYPFIYFTTVITLFILFTLSIMFFFKLKKWAYRTFFILTLLLHSFLILIYIYIT